MSTLTRYTVQLRAEVAGDTLHGHAAVWDQMAKVPGGWERMDRRAFDEVLDSTDSDPVALINHDPTLLLGRRSAGTLRLKADDEGLAFEVDLPDTSYANDLRRLIERGDVQGGSIGFLSEGDAQSRAPDGRVLETVTRVTYLRDVGPVTLPAYKGTDVALRHYDFDRPSGRSRMIRARHRAHVSPEGVK